MLTIARKQPKNRPRIFCGNACASPTPNRVINSAVGSVSSNAKTDTNPSASGGNPSRPQPTTI